MSLQEKHDVLDFLLLLPALFDLLDPHFPDPGNRIEPVRVGLDDLKGVLAKFLDDLLRVLRADALDQAAAKVFLDPEYSGRQCLLECLHGELPAVFRIHPPASAKLQNGSHMDIRHGADNGHKVRISLHAALDDRVAVLSILICDSFHYTAKMIHV